MNGNSGGEVLNAVPPPPPDGGALSTASTQTKNSQADLDIRQIITTDTPGSIPTVIFVEDVETFVTKSGTSVEAIIGAMTELHQKYKLMDAKLANQKANLKVKIPEIESTLEIVQLLDSKKDSEEDEELKASYPLSDIIHARAKIECNGTVCLWLGADVMVEYTYDEALEMLEKNLASAKAKLEETSRDMDHVKNQSITVEVNMARIFNYNVKQRRLEKEAKEADEKKLG